MRGRRQDHPREDGGGKARALIVDETVFYGELHVAGAAAPALVRPVAEAHGERRGQLDVLEAAVIHVEAGVVVERRAAPLAGGEGVDLPVTGIGRRRIV